MLAVVVVFFVCSMVAFFLYFNMFCPEARAARRFFKLMPVDQIQSIVLEPVPYDPKPLTRREISIKDRQQIADIAGLFHTAHRCLPNHPQEKWSMVLHFRLKDRDFSGQLNATSNQGVLLYYGLDTTGGPVYATYRQDALGPLVESIVRAQLP